MQSRRIPHASDAASSQDVIADWSDASDPDRP